MEFESFRKFDKSWSRGCWIAFLVVLGFFFYCAFGAWHYFTFDESMVIGAMECNYAEVKIWLDHGADPNSTFEGQSALEMSRRCTDDRITKLLISRGATE